MDEGNGAAAVERQEDPMPVCPFCGQDPAGITALPIVVGTWKCVTTYCSNPTCRKIYGTSVVGQTQQIQKPTPGVVRGLTRIPS
jgi:hypothetical protein